MANDFKEHPTNQCRYLVVSRLEIVVKLKMFDPDLNYSYRPLQCRKYGGIKSK